jgi:AraC-like DNA-binding protein
LNETRISALLTEHVGATFVYATATSPHAEHGTTALIGLDADVTVVAGDRVVRGRAVIVPPDVVYAARCPGPTVSALFDPELSPRVAGLARGLGPSALVGRTGAALAGGVVAHRGALVRPAVLAGLAAETETLLATGAGRAIDRRVAGLVEALRDPDAAADHRAAIARTRLSAAHLQALFSRDVGTPMRTYRLWRRLLHALAQVGPLDLTAAAHAAGFADLAHFSRTCRRMLGYSPSGLRARLVG